NSALKNVHRKLLELHDILEISEAHGSPDIKSCLLLARASTLKIPAADNRTNPSNISALSEVIGTGGISYAGSSSDMTTSPVSPRMPSAALASAATQHSAVFTHIKRKCDEVLQMPGIKLLEEYPSEEDVVGEQCHLLAAHAQHIGELVQELELLSALYQHSAAHPIYEVARGLESYFGGLITSLALKLDIIAADMHRTLYAPDVSRAVERLWEILKAQERRLVKERASLDERLAIYRDAGSEFQEIATAYSAVLTET
ncbi:hypothetical protein GGF37_007465, partial [Kickxella alabastrina]